jgi:TolA-binding protein
MNKIFSILITVVLLGLNSASYAQKNIVYNSPVAEYQSAIELFNKEKFGAAQKLFNKTIELIKDEQSEVRISAEYYAAICSIELYNIDAEYRLMKFMSSYPENSKVKLANFQLGKLQYRQKKYNDAAQTLASVDIYDLSSDELTEYYFKLGYSYFMLKDYEKAKKPFFEIKDIDTKYFAAANYFYSHIAYSEKNYETALKGFQKLVDDESFGPVVPYYIAQIYYLQGKYAEVIAYAPPLLDSANTKRAPEIARIIGESYFKTNLYAQSIPYLELYQKKTTNTITNNDNYELGFAYYKSGECKKAITIFEKVITADDSLSQNAYYHLADCYLKTGNKKFARNAFQSAYKADFYPEIKEDALFNYAKLSYEMSYNPYNDAIVAFEQFINDYPESSNIDDARDYLVNIYMTTKNYKDALASIEKIKVLDEKLAMAYQKIAYFRGVELFNDKKITDAIVLFDKSNTQPYDKIIKAQCYYWKAEAQYRLSQFDSAIENYDAFLLLPGSFSLPEYNKAYYSLGYCYFKQKSYKTAIKNFRKFVTNKTTETDKILNDTYLRIGDCYFVSKEYSDAAEYYDKAISLKNDDADYALFQKGLCSGVLGKYDNKIAALSKLIEEYPKSAYDDDAKFELANTYLIKNNNEKALEYYNKVIAEYPNCSYVKKAMVKIGMIYYNSDNDDKAMAAFKNVVTEYPSTSESKDALVSIRNIYMDRDSVDNFYEYVKSLSFEFGSKTEQDSVTYMAKENLYMTGDCEKSTVGFGKYIQQFPKGYFIANAYYYKADCEYRAGDYNKALVDYAAVLNMPQNKFSEYSLAKSAAISYSLNRYDSAITYYSELEKNAEYKSYILEARTAIMRSYYKLQNYKMAVVSAKSLLNTEKVADETKSEAHLTIAKSALNMDSLALAQTEFELTYKLSPASENGAEAKYNIADIYYKQGDYVTAEKTIFEIINQIPSYDYWIGKSFILLSDVYVKTGNPFQAKHTLQSIIDNYEGADLLQIAHEKLNAIIESEKIQEQKKTQEDLEIKFDGNNPKTDKLFEDAKQKEGENNE